MANFHEAVAKTLDHEGGYVNDPSDRGGETKFGISKRSYPEVDIAGLSRDDAKDIYKRDYWDEVGGDAIESQEIAERLFDVAVNMGNRRAVRMAQNVVGTEADGLLGPKTLAAINAAEVNRFMDRYKLEQIRRYADICNASGVQKKFLLGWINRALS